MRRTIDTLRVLMVSYCLLISRLAVQHQAVADVQVSSLQELCCRKLPAIMFEKLTERPRVHRWWKEALGLCTACLSCFKTAFMWMFSKAARVSAAQQHPLTSNWAAIIGRQHNSLGMPSAFSISGTVGLNWLCIQGKVQGQHCRFCNGLQCHCSKQ